MEPNNLAKKLKELRAIRGMSQEYLAEESHVSLRTIQRIENNESTPLGETIKRIAVALDVEMNDLIGISSNADETSDLKGTIIFLKKLLSKTEKKSEVKTFKNFIQILTDLKEKDLSQDQLEKVESYLTYLELEKIPSFSNELFKGKLGKFKKYLLRKMKFVPTNYYTTWASSFAVSFAVAFVVQPNIELSIKLGVIAGALLLIGIGITMDLRMKRHERSLAF